MTFPRQITGIPRIWKSNLRFGNLLWFGIECISSLKWTISLFLCIWRELLYWNKRFYPTPPHKFCCRVICTSKRTTISTIIQTRQQTTQILGKNTCFETLSDWVIFWMWGGKVREILLKYTSFVSIFYLLPMIELMHQQRWGISLFFDVIIIG